MDRYILQTYQSCDEKCHVEMESTFDDLRKTKLACTIQIFKICIIVHQDCYVIQSKSVMYIVELLVIKTS